MAVKSSFKNMTLCLLVICLVCSALLAGVNVLTKKPIDAAVAAKTTKAVAAVTPEFDSMEAVSDSVAKYYIVSKDSAVVGYAIETLTSGFGGNLKLMVGFDVNGLIINTSVLECNETPGLGAKCKDALFADQFKGFDPTVKTLSVKKDGGDVDAITASTITSRAYSLAVANAVKVFQAITAVPAEEAAETIEEGGSDNE